MSRRKEKMKITKNQGAIVCAIVSVASVLLKSTDARHLGFGDFLVSAPLAALRHSDSILWVCVSKIAFIAALYQGLCWIFEAKQEQAVPIVTALLTGLAIIMSSFELVIA